MYTIKILVLNLTLKLTLGPTAPGTPPSPGRPCTQWKVEILALHVITHIYIICLTDFCCHKKMCDSKPNMV